MESKYQQVVDAATKALEGLGKKSSAKEIYSWVAKNHPEVAEQVGRSWAAYLTKATNDNGNPIRREPGSYGYMLSEVETPPPSEEKDTGNSQREAKLYSILVSWLTSKEYRARDVSSCRNGGRWGNPDVVGVRSESALTSDAMIEVASIEAKISSRDWKAQFFEAVSHKRFADRVYFAFGVGANSTDLSSISDYEELREYAERFRIGVLAIFMQPAQYDILCTGRSEDLDTLDLAETRILEVWPAVYDPSHPFLRNRFLRIVLKLENAEEFYRFGEDQAD